MINEILEYSTQPYIIFWSVTMICSGVLALISLISGIGADLGFDLDLDVDADTDLEFGADASGSLFKSFCIFLNLNTIPLTIILFLLVSLNWLFGFYVNRLINPDHNSFIGWVTFIAVFVGSIPLCKICSHPLKKLFKAMVEDKESQTHAVGNVCTTTTEVTTTSGQATIKEGPTIVNLMVCTEDGQTIGRDKKAVVLKHNKKNNRYIISQVDDDIFK